MIRYRSYQAQDALAVDALLGEKIHDVRIDRDNIAVATLNGKVIGVIVGRPLVLVHELEVERQHPLARKIAEGLVNYGFGLLRGKGHIEVLFDVEEENTMMHRFLHDAGATDQGPGRLYSMEIE